MNVRVFEPSTIGYKLFRVRRDGTLGPLFIARDTVIPFGEWVESRPVPTRGFKFRPGWHACSKKSAPHLSKKGRVWCRVLLQNVEHHHRPASQGGLWYTAERLKVIEVINIRKMGV